MILALAGGVGGAKLADGLARALRPGELVVVVNTADDFEHLGLHVSPDLDTVMYTLAGIANPATGWGMAGETWSFMTALAGLGGPAWFRLGDKDLATHVVRSRRLAAGATLSSVTSHLCERLGVRHAIAPMSDDPVRTFVTTDAGTLEFQQYFVKAQCKPRVISLEYRGAARARPSESFRATLAERSLEGIILCPSNPYLSIAPMLEIPGVRDGIERCRKVIAVSPIVAGQAVKGPAAKIMAELGVEASALGTAHYYKGLIRGLVIDRADGALAPAIERLGMEVRVTDTLMSDVTQRLRLAAECLAMVRGEETPSR